MGVLVVVGRQGRALQRLYLLVGGWDSLGLWPQLLRLLMVLLLVMVMWLGRLQLLLVVLILTRLKWWCGDGGLHHSGHLAAAGSGLTSGQADHVVVVAATAAAMIAPTRVDCGVWQ